MPPPSTSSPDLYLHFRQQIPEAAAQRRVRHRRHIPRRQLERRIQLQLPDQLPGIHRIIEPVVEASLRSDIRADERFLETEFPPELIAPHEHRLISTLAVDLYLKLPRVKFECESHRQ